jgi:hypothetical protein
VNATSVAVDRASAVSAFFIAVSIVVGRVLDDGISRHARCEVTGNTCPVPESGGFPECGFPEKVMT